MKRAGLLAALILLALGVTRDVRAEKLTIFHFQLNKSAPAAESAGPAPSEIRLWFSQAPQEGTTSIRVVNAAGDALHTGDVIQDDEEPTAFGVALHGALPDGPYRVVWRAVGQDGHVVRGDFPFTVATP